MQDIPIFPFFRESENSDCIFSLRRKLNGSCLLHGHDYYELELILAGTGTQWINNIPFSINPGSLYLITPRDEHRLVANIELISIHFKPTVARQIEIACEAYAITLGEEEFALFKEILTNTLSQNQTPYKEKWLTGSTMLLLSHLLAHGTKYPSTNNKHPMREVLRFLHSNYSNPDIRLNDAAKLCGLSPCHFSVKFREVVGCGYSEYLSSYRLQSACSLLSDHTLSITEIIYQSGFSSVAHFYRLFRQRYNCTPNQYRRCH